MKLEGKVAIVTGAGSKMDGLGTGKATAVLFAREGARVVLVDRHEDRVNLTKEWIEREGGTATALALELTDPSAPQKIVGEAIGQYGRADIFVSNAAFFKSGPFLDSTLEDMQEAVAVNLIAPYMICKEVIPHMIEGGGGSIMFITSILAMRGSGPASYASTKAALMGLTTTLANQFGPKNITVNCIAPGTVNTPMRNQLVAKAGLKPEDVDMSANTSLGREGDAWDIARAALFLGGPDGNYITGHLLPVDGGTTTRMPQG